MKKKNLAYSFYKFSVLTFLMMVSAFNYNIFINPVKIVAGGVNGISIIAENVLGILPSITIFVISAVILIIGVVLSEYELVLSALYTSIIYPIFVEITSSLSGIIEITNQDYIIIAVFSGIISGMVSGIACKLNTSQGGIILIAQLLNKKKKLSISLLNTIFGLIIIFAGGLVFGLENVLYALIFLFSSKMVMEKIIVGIASTKVFHIITSKEEKIIKFITEDLNSKFTAFNVTGAYNCKTKTVIMVSIPTMDYFWLREEVKKIDSHAFILITNAYESKIVK